MFMERKQANKFGLKILRLTGIYAAIAFAICFSVLVSLNNSVVFAETTTSPQASAATVGSDATTDLSSLSETSASPSTTQKPEVLLSGIPADAQNIAFSYDDRYCTYMAGTHLHIKDMKTGDNVKTITTSGIRWPVLMNDRNILMYFTVSGTTLALNTYNIDSNQSVKQTSLTFPSGAKIKAVDYSNATSLVFINLAQTQNGTETDSVYSINIMKKVRKFSLSSVVDNMVLLGKENSLYYDDAQNNLYLHGKPFTGLKEGKLLGRDIEDRVYALSVDNDMVYILSNEKLDKTLVIPNTNYIEFYSDKNSVYAVYNGYIINLSGDMNAKLQYDRGLQFIGMGGSNAYFRDAENNIIGLIKSSIA